MQMTALHLAAASSNPEVVRVALLEKPDVNARSDPNGFTPLHMCVTGTDSSDRQEIIALLHAAGADLESKTYGNELTPLILASIRNKPMCVLTLIRCGANVHAIECNGATALHGAAYYGYVEVTKVLLEARADPELADKHSKTPISLALDKGNTQIHELLLASCRR